MPRRRKLWSRKFIFFTFFYWFLFSCGLVCAWTLGNKEPECGLSCTLVGGLFGSLLYAFVYCEHADSVMWHNW